MGIFSRDDDENPVATDWENPAADPVADSIVWKGADDLRPFLVPLASLHTHERNPRRGNVQRISESLLRFGQLSTVLVSDGTIIAGNHRYLAAQLLGWTHIAALEEDMAKSESDAFLLTDNRTSDLSSYEEDMLAQSLQELAESAEGLEGTGWTEDEATEFLAALAVGDSVDDLLVTAIENENPFVGPPPDQESLGEGNPEKLRAFSVMLEPDLYSQFVRMVDYLEKPFGLYKRDLVIYEAVKRSAELEGYGEDNT